MLKHLSKGMDVSCGVQVKGLWPLTCTPQDTSIPLTVPFIRSKVLNRCKNRFNTLKLMNGTTTRAPSPRIPNSPIYHVQTTEPASSPIQHFGHDKWDNLRDPFPPPSLIPYSSPLPQVYSLKISLNLCVT